jgi:hypothetical protein
MDFKWIEHSFSRNNNLLWLLLDRKTPYKSSNFFGSFPFCELPKSFLPSPDTRMNNLKEEMTTLRIEDKNGTIYRLCCKIAFECFMNGNSVHISIVNKPDNLIAK